MNFKHSKETTEKILKALDQPEKRQFQKRTRILFEGEKEIASDKKDESGKPLPGVKVKVS